MYNPQLETFLRVADAGSFNRAAEESFITPTKQITRFATDAAMTIALLLLMAYSLVGEAAHEWIGMTMLALFVLIGFIAAKTLSKTKKHIKTVRHLSTEAAPFFVL